MLVDFIQLAKLVVWLAALGAATLLVGVLMGSIREQAQKVATGQQ